MLAVSMPRTTKEAGQKLKASCNSRFSSQELHGYLTKWNKSLLKSKREILCRKPGTLFQCVHNCTLPHPEIGFVSTLSR